MEDKFMTYVGIFIVVLALIVIVVSSPSQIDTIIDNSFDLDDFIERCSVKATDKNYKRLNKMYDDLINQFNDEHNEIVNEYKKELEKKDEVISELRTQIQDLGYEPIY